MNRKTLTTRIIIFIIVAGAVAAGVAFSTPRRTAGSVGAPRVVPGLAVIQQGTPPASPDNSTAEALLRTDIPERNLYQIVPRLRKNLSLLTPVPTPIARARKVGDKDTFFVIKDASTGTYRTVTATLQTITPHSYFWVEDGLEFDQAALQKSADFFENNIYPTNHKYFGLEGSPGPDGDTHIHVLTTRFEQAAGYFSSEDTYPRTLVPYSNQRNIIYMNIDVRPGSNEYIGDMAHEFQHLIHNYEAQHAAGWIDEGMSELAIRLNGFDVGGVLRLFARNPDTQLNTWANEPQASGAHYAGSYLFFDYAAGRFGPDFTRAVIHAPREGINGIQSVLDQTQSGMRFEDLFSDWAVANWLNDPKVEDGRYAYTNEPTFRIMNEPSVSQYPITHTGTIHEFGTDYFSLQPSNPNVTIYFTGTTTAKLLPVDAHGGRWMCYSNRADLMDTTLTREVDLTKVTKATLQYSTWYDIEMDFDYAYVEVSSDGGKTFDILPGKYTTTSNPNGASYGPAYSGRSGVTDPQSKAPAQWIQDQVDLTHYAGKKILLRFEYITDDAFNAPSWAIDDISIPEIGFTDNVENGTDGWQSNGFIRTDNVLPQRFIVTVVQQGTTTSVNRISLDAANRGRINIDGLGKEVAKAELIINAFAPTTTEPTQYEFAVVPR